jgi:tetrahydromethanopterin S-methyltransferase subunit F
MEVVMDTTERFFAGMFVVGMAGLAIGLTWMMLLA